MIIPLGRSRRAGSVVCGSVVLPTDIQPTQPIANGAVLDWMRPTANGAPFLV